MRRIAMRRIECDELSGDELTVRQTSQIDITTESEDEDGNCVKLISDD